MLDGINYIILSFVVRRYIVDWDKMESNFLACDWINSEPRIFVPKYHSFVWMALGLPKNKNVDIFLRFCMFDRGGKNKQPNKHTNKEQNKIENANEKIETHIHTHTTHI